MQRSHARSLMVRPLMPRASSRPSPRWRRLSAVSRSACVDPVVALEVGDRLRHPHDPVAPARAQRADRVGPGEGLLGAVVEPDVPPDEPRVHLAVAPSRGARQPESLALASGGNAVARLCRGGLGRGPQLGLGRPLDVDQQVHAVEQRAAQPSAVAPQVRLAAPAAVADAREPARARVGRRDEHEPGREHERPLAADDRHAARPRAAGAARRGSSAGTPRARRGTGRRGARASPRPDGAALRRRRAPTARSCGAGARNGRARDESGGVQPRDAVDPRHLDRLGAGHRRQDRGHPPGEHRLAGAGRALEQQVVAAGGRDLERQQRRGVAADVGQIGLRRRGRGTARAGSRRRQRRERRPREHVGRGPQARDSGDLEPVDERRLAGALARDDQTGGARPGGRPRRRPARPASRAARRRATARRTPRTRSAAPTGT